MGSKRQKMGVPLSKSDALSSSPRSPGRRPSASGAPNSPNKIRAKQIAVLQRAKHQPTARHGATSTATTTPTRTATATSTRPATATGSTSPSTARATPTTLVSAALDPAPEKKIQPRDNPPSCSSRATLPSPATRLALFSPLSRSIDIDSFPEKLHRARHGA